MSLLHMRPVAFWLLAIVATQWLCPGPARAQPDATDSEEQPSPARVALDKKKQDAADLERRGELTRALEAYEALVDEHAAELSPGELQELKAQMLALEYKTSKVIIGQLPDGTQIFVDGKKRGVTPLNSSLRVMPGSHELKLFKPGFETLERRVVAQAGSPTIVNAQLEPQATSGDVAVQVKLPAGVALEPTDQLDVLVDGKRVGSVPWRGALPPGQHSVALEARRFVAPEQVVDVQKGRVQDVVLLARARMGALEIDARSGTIKLNGRFAAQNYFSGKVAPGRYVVLVERPGFDPYTTTVEVQPGQRLNIPIPIATHNSEVESYERTDLKDGESQTGLYLDIAAMALFGLKSTHEWQDHCPELSDPVSGAALNTSCDTRVPIGGALGARVGLRLGGVVGIEGFALGAGDWSRASLHGLEIPGVPSYLQDMQIGRVGGVLGGGLRLSTPPAGVRLTAGGGAGLAFRRVYTNVSSLDGSSTNYVAPAVLVDVSLMLGNTLTLGIVGWAEFSRTISVKPDLSKLVGASQTPKNPFDSLGKVTVFHGTQLFVGPIITLHSGN